jgi:hypothetical protein
MEAFGGGGESGSATASHRQPPFRDVRPSWPVGRRREVAPARRDVHEGGHGEVTGPFFGSDSGEPLFCWACARPLAIEWLAREGFLKSRAEQDGGPFLLSSCPHCRRRLRCERNSAGRHFVSPADDFNALDHLLQYFDADLRRRYWEERAWRARHDEERRRFFEWESGPPRGPSAGGGRRAPEPGASAPGRDDVRVDAPVPTDAVRRALGVVGATARDPWHVVAREFRRQCKLSHPDRFALHEEAYRRVAARRFAALKDAYDLLRREWRPIVDR